MTPPPLLRYRAGRDAVRLLRRDGFAPERIAVIAGPASGPKWLVLPGIDRALIRLGLTQGRRRLLVGASAGGWRMAALSARKPKDVLEKLVDSYVGVVFPKGAKPPLISAAYRKMWQEILPPPEAEGLLRHDYVDLALHTARQRWPGRHRIAQAGGLALAFAGNFLNPRAMTLACERVLFHTAPERYGRFAGNLARLDKDNLHDALIATGSVPIYFEPVRNPKGAPPGLYVDGGVTDYHLNQRHPVADGEIVLFPHFQERITPCWLDKHRPRREPPAEVTSNVLQVFPSQEFVSRLPDGRIPDRDDFFRYENEPEKRLARWRVAVGLAAELEDVFLEDTRSGRLIEALEPMPA
jgi:hypothetical protein